MSMEDGKTENEKTQISGGIMLVCYNKIKIIPFLVK